MDKKQNTFNISPFGPIPNDWEVRELGDIFDYINTPSFSRDNLTNEKTLNEIFYIHYGDIHATYKSELLDFEIETRVPYLKDEFCNDNFNFLKDGDLVIADASEDYHGIGESIEIKNIKNRKVIGGLHTLVIRDKISKTVDGFRTYIFRNYFVHNEIKKIATGISVFGISKGNLSKLKIPLPPLPEQQKIASILSTWDEAISKTQQIINQLKERNRGLQQQLLTGKKRLKGFSEKWKSESLYKHCNELSLKNSENKGFIVLSCTKYKGLVSSLEYFGKQIFSNDISTYKIVPKNCFAYATNHIEEGSIGLQTDSENALISPMYTVFKTNESILDNTFLFRLLKSHIYIHEYKRRMEGSIDRRGGLRWDEFSKIKIPVFSLEEQRCISNVLNEADDEVQIQEQKLEALKQQKKGLMQQLLTGKKRVKI